DGGESKTEIPSKDTQGEGETAQAGADGGVQNDAPQHNDNVPANGTSDTQPEKERMPDSDAVGSDGGNQDVEKVAKSQDDTEEKFVSENPDSQDKQVQSAADTQPKTGVFGEKYFDGTGEITALVIGGETIDLTKANEPVSRNHPGLMSDFDKVMVSQNQYKNLIY
ncbi:TPA: transferrin-binding protein-like solute binding protein, partial [Neisseria meningitidis]